MLHPKSAELMRQSISRAARLISAQRDGMETRNLIISRAMALGFYGIGIGKTLIHLDIRSGPPVLWVYPD